MQKTCNPKYPEIQNTVRKPNLRIIGKEESEDLQFKRPVYIFKKIMEENFPNPKERDAHEHTRSLQNFKQTGPGQKVLLAQNNQNTKCTKQRKIIKSINREGSSNI